MGKQEKRIVESAARVFSVDETGKTKKYLVYFKFFLCTATGKDPVHSGKNFFAFAKQQKKADAKASVHTRSLPLKEGGILTFLLVA